MMSSNYNFNYDHDYNNTPMKMKTMKRKELEVDDVSDELHDFSLTSPARKIRRLNAQLPPIMEEDRDQEILPVPFDSTDSETDKAKAIVLYKPLSQSHTYAPTVSVSLDLISGLKNQFLPTSQSGNWKLAGDEELLEKNNATKNNSLAVVPWVPSQFPVSAAPGMDANQTEVTELMEADEMGEATMDIEENNAYEVGGMREGDGLNQWQQQHCMIPQLPQLVGAPGSGKSTFCDNVIRSSARPWARICQDTINKGKSGTKVQCLTSASIALKEGKSVFIDRCNLEKDQRTDFVKLGGPQVEVHAVVLDLPAKLCISRSVKRIGHEGNLEGGKAAAVVNRMLQKKELPKLSEGFSRITLCQNESDVKAPLDTYSGLGPLDTLPHGFFGQKNPDGKVQLGIMKFLKKVEASSSDAGSNASSTQDYVPPQITEEKNYRLTGQENASSLSDTAGEEVKGTENPVMGFVNQNDSSSDVPTLAFPSISTSDFQFDNEKASDVIIEKVEEFMNKLGNARLVLVDLTHGSKILSLVRAKAAEKNINPDKFLTFVGDITRLYTGGGLRCNVIANAANWRLKPGGGGVNAAIFSAAGYALEVATKERAKSIYPGNAVVVPLSPTSPLCSREGVTHVIHVLGPNMNPHRPNYLGGDYEKGCEILRKTYTSLFEGFLSVVRSQEELPKGRNEHISLEPSVSRDHSEDSHGNYISTDNQKIKRDGVHEYEKSKKCKGAQNGVGADINLSGAGNLHADNEKIGVSTVKAWGSWAQALYLMAMHPERHKDDLLELSDDVVVLNDLYPKAQKHLLVLARYDHLDGLADVRKEHLQILKTMHAVGLKWAEKFLNEDASLVFRLGYHSAPSMRQLHLHVISQDFNSKHLKNKKHWNSFNTAFFRDSVDVLEEISNHGKATIKDDDRLLSMELRCHRCRSAHPNIPRLNSHISNCRAPFPSALLQNCRLVLAPSDTCNP